MQDWKKEVPCHAVVELWEFNIVYVSLTPNLSRAEESCEGLCRSTGMLLTLQPLVTCISRFYPSSKHSRFPRFIPSFHHRLLCISARYEVRSSRKKQTGASQNCSQGTVLQENNPCHGEIVAFVLDVQSVGQDCACVSVCEVHEL